MISRLMHPPVETIPSHFRPRNNFWKFFKWMKCLYVVCNRALGGIAAPERIIFCLFRPLTPSRAGLNRISLTPYIRVSVGKHFLTRLGT